ncbi:ribosomal-protein-alanine N-acetyltransferase [Leptolyngbya sp. BL0902]|uniref:GNAT family N-acetyltransferase n=1 Tax=Leptolyngbya sp. BL0902 TaxID=1115757 RepID=UPI0018E880DE|nr:GNAT family N-acetyltransferase [Leptolyngbya sp. BL0902]QQE65269.1 ribosomal-protein-alanine N-acetyltransferase [Leptolyngbya sp. BL0902]
MGQIFCTTPTPDHIPALVDFDQQVLGGLWSADGYQREMASPNSCLRALSFSNLGASAAIKDDSKVNYPDLLGVGCYWAILDEAHITLLGILPTHQRQGLGRWLLLHLLEDACDREMSRATLEVRISNQRAIDLYESLGFSALGQRKRYYHDGEDALVLWQNSLKTAAFQENLRSRRIATEARLAQQGIQIMTPKNVANRT